MRWFEKYIGLRYCPKNFDCAHLVELVLEKEFQKKVSFPRVSEDIKEKCHSIMNLTKDYLETTDTPTDGDCVLMRGMYNMFHIGLYVNVDGREYVLHNFSIGFSTILSPINELKRFHLSSLGYYKWL